MGTLQERYDKLIEALHDIRDICRQGIAPSGIMGNAEWQRSRLDKVHIIVALALREDDNMRQQGEVYVPETKKPETCDACKAGIPIGYPHWIIDNKHYHPGCARLGSDKTKGE